MWDAIRRKVLVNNKQLFNHHLVFFLGFGAISSFKFVWFIYYINSSLYGG